MKECRKCLYFDQCDAQEVCDNYYPIDNPDYIPELDPDYGADTYYMEYISYLDKFYNEENILFK